MRSSRRTSTSSGEWLVFTDADVHFAPDLVRRAIALAEAKRVGSLTLLGAREDVHVRRENRDDVFCDGVC